MKHPPEPASQDHSTACALPLALISGHDDRPQFAQQSDRGTLSRPFPRLVILTLPFAMGVVLASLAGSFSLRELAGTVSGLGLGLLLCSSPRFRLLALLITWMAVGIALCQPPFRGTHRWLTLSPDYRINIVLPLLAVTCVLLTQVRSLRVVRTIWGMCFLSLALCKAFVLLALLGLCSASWPGLFGPLRARHVLLLFVAALAILVVGSPNRRLRLHEFGANESYQSKQARRNLLELNWITPATKPHHLPAARTDLALLDVARSRGAFFALLQVFAFFPWLALGPAISPPATVLAKLILWSFVAHLGVCLSVIPAVGAPAPFLGVGFSQWAFSCTILAAFSKTILSNELSG